MKDMLPTISMPEWSFKNDPTINLLLHCVSTKGKEQAPQKIKALAQDELDWQALVSLAIEHRVAPLLYRCINESYLGAVPVTVREGLRQYCQNIAVRNLFMTAELSRVLSLMSLSGVDTLPYKGPLLSQTLYKDLNLRQFGDLDIVIQPQDMLSVEKLLIAEGYRPYFGKKTAAELSDYMAAKNEHTYDFYHDQKKILIEVHWRFWPVFFSSVKPKDIWHRREPAHLAGKTVTNLKIEDSLIILCMHGSRHRWQRLSWLCDIAMLLDNYPELNWNEATSTAQQWGAKRMLYLGLYLSHVWLDAPLPAAVLQKVLAEPAIASLSAQVDEQLFHLKSSKWPLSSTRYQIQARERWQDKAICTQSLLHWILRGLPSEHHDAKNQ